MPSRRKVRLTLERLDTRELASVSVTSAPSTPTQNRPTATATSNTARVNIANLAPVNADRRNYSHIRVAMLAYSGTPLTDFERGLLKNSVDLLIPNVQYLERYNTVSPGVPQLIYSNLSNIYLDLYTDWLTYADKNRLDREAAFYHVNKALAFSGDSGSSKPVTWFWAVADGSDAAGWRDHTPITKSSDTSFRIPANGQAAVIGYPEKFRELNFNIADRGNSRWSGVLEYASSVDSQGRPTAWKTLNTISNSTGGFRQTGRVIFDPPSDWKTATINSSDRLFYVRIRSTGTGTGPLVRNVLGRDYVNAKNTIRGVIPAFDAAADRNRDGYLNDSEYARRAKGFDARFRYESRLFYVPYGQNRFATNPSNNSFRAWALDYSRRFIASHPHADGLFFDNSYGRLQNKATDLIESTANYATDYGTLLGTIDRQLGSKWVLANTSGAGQSALPTVSQGVSFLEEFALRPLAHNHNNFEYISQTVSERIKVMGSNGYAILDTLPNGGSPTDPRTQIASLAYYYMLADPKKTYVMFNGGYEPSTSWKRHWTEAVRYNVGQPRGTWSTFATGRDPGNRGLTFKVYQRQYDRALVLYKPLSYNRGTSGTTSDSSATYHKLNGRYRPLRADGTLGPVVTSVILRNGEGAILIKA